LTRLYTMEEGRVGTQERYGASKFLNY